ncbi:11389_t:CDS:2, partial [Funneliformis geosporum]
SAQTFKHKEVKFPVLEQAMSLWWRMQPLVDQASRGHDSHGGPSYDGSRGCSDRGGSRAHNGHREKFKTKEEIIKWKYCGKIGAKSENNFMKKYPVKAFEKSEEDPEEKEYMGGPIKIKISVEDDFTSSFLKLPDCVSIDV